jgi:hypothetical protein
MLYPTDTASVVTASLAGASLARASCQARTAGPMNDRLRVTRSATVQQCFAVRLNMGHTMNKFVSSSDHDLAQKFFIFSMARYDYAIIIFYGGIGKTWATRSTSLFHRAITISHRSFWRDCYRPMKQRC